MKGYMYVREEGDIVMGCDVPASPINVDAEDE